MKSPVQSRTARRILLSCAAGALFGYGCQQVSWYHHAPTEEVLRTYDLDAAKLTPFRASDVVVVPTIVQGHAQLGLLFLSKAPKTIKLTRVSVDDKVMELGESLQIDQKIEGKEIYRGSKQLPIVGVESGAPFDALGSDGYQVVVEVDGKKLEYEFPRTTSHEAMCTGW